VPESPPFEPRSPFETAFRAGIEGADAYRAVRAGLRLHDDILRIGNRFVPVDRFREIAFVALGNAAGAMAHAAQQMLGDRLTQGFVASAVPAPESLQFQSLMVPDPWPGSPASTAALASVLELTSDLHAEDLLLVLLSPGAFSVTAGPPTGWDPGAWRELLQRVVARSGPIDAVRVARVLGTGAVGGRLGATVREPTVVTLVVDRGEGAEWIGGGPTVPLRPEEVASVRSLAPEFAGSEALAVPGPAAGRNVHRPVVVTGPADAVEAAGNLLAGHGWISRLVSLHLPGSPEEVASRFVEGIETIRREQVSEPLSSAAGSTPPVVPVDWGQEGPTATPRARPESRGLAVFAGASFGTIEGGERVDDIRAFLRAASGRSTRREAYLGALRTAGEISGRGGDAGSWFGRRAGSDPATGPVVEAFSVRAGFTDVGTMLLAFVPWIAR
jgi:glycerate-2-kinase